MLKKQLNLFDLVILGWVFIGPAAAMGLYGVLTAVTNGAAALVYLLAMLLMGLTVYAYAHMARAVPSSGSVYAYARAALSPKAGFLVGWMVLLDYLFVPAVAYLFTGIALNAIWPNVPVWLGAAGAVAVTTLLNLAGVKKAAKVTLAVLLAEVVCLLAVLAAGAWVLLHEPNPTPWWQGFVGAAKPEWGALFAGVSIAMMSFLGFDAIATFTEEYRGGARRIGWAMALCLLLAGVFFVAQIYVAARLPQPSAEAVRAGGSALQGKLYYDIVKTQIGQTLGTVLAAVKAVGATFAALVAQAAAARLLFGMARDGGLPAVLARTHTRHGTPQYAVAVCAAANLVLVLAAALADNGLAVLVSCVDVGALVAFVALHVSVPAYFLVRKGRRGLRAYTAYGVIPAIGAALFVPVMLHVATPAKIAAALWLALGVISLLYRSRNIKKMVLMD